MCLGSSGKQPGWKTRDGIYTMKKRITRFPAVVAIILLLLGGCSRNKSPRYIFFVTLDTARADFMDYVRQNNDLTPHFADLAGEGVVFENAYTVIPITLPSHAAMFYSLPPHNLRIFNNGNINHAEEPSLAQLLKDRGFRTGAVVSLGVLRSEAGLNRGFDDYLDDFKPSLWYRTAAEVNRDAMKLVRNRGNGRAFFWIHYSDPHGPYFCPDYPHKFLVRFNGKEILSGKSTDQFMVQLDLDLPPGLSFLKIDAEIPDSDLSGHPIQVKNIAFMNFEVAGIGAGIPVRMHLPRHWNRVEQRRDKVTYFSKSSKSRVALENRGSGNRKVKISFLLQLHMDPAVSKNLYREEMVYLDREFGRFIQFLKQEGVFKDAAFVVMGDHGEGLGELHDGHVGHIHYLNRVYSHVPLFLAGKGIERMAARKEPVSNLDIAPTILDLAGFDAAPHMQGRTLLGKQIPDRRLFLATYAPEAYHNAFSLIAFPYQLIFTPDRPSGEKTGFFNLEKDRYGEHDLFKDPAADQRLKADLVNKIKALAKALSGDRDKPGKYSKRQEEILKSLGYL